MAKVFSDIVVSQLKQMYRWWIANKNNLVNPSRRRGIGGGGGGVGEEKILAYCKTDAPHSSNISCYLKFDAVATNIFDYGDGTGLGGNDEIVVSDDVTGTYPSGRNVAVSGSSGGGNDGKYSVIASTFASGFTFIEVRPGSFTLSSTGGTITSVPESVTASNSIIDYGDGTAPGGNDFVAVFGSLIDTYQVGRTITISGSSEHSNNDNYTVLLVEFIEPNTYISIAAGSINDSGPATGGSVSTVLDSAVVKCNIANGEFLDEAMPLLTDGLPISIELINGVFHCGWGFNGAAFRS